ncbi:MAG: uncharacterized protein JWP04_399 [Belnapia sp.]|nr:uncharacterized protein [Belnapia sp.]
MSAALDHPPPATLAEFLDWEQFQECRYEWDGVQPVAVVGGTFGHSELASRFYDILRAHLRGGPCTVVRTNVKVMTQHGTRIHYPDAVVTCTPMRGSDTVVPAPVLILEVLSETTAAIDRGTKRAEYGALPSLAHYAMLVQDAPIAVICDRAGNFEERQEREAIDLQELGLTIPLAALYQGLLAG